MEISLYVHAILIQSQGQHMLQSKLPVNCEYLLLLYSSCEIHGQNSETVFRQVQNQDGWRWGAVNVVAENDDTRELAKFSALN